jgi:hypothetical protein
MHLDLSAEETAALTQELHDIFESDRYPFSARIRTLRPTLAKLRPEPAHAVAATEGQASTRTIRGGGDGPDARIETFSR